MPGFNDDFSMAQPNAEIALYDGPLLLTIKGRTTEFAGRIGLRWFPSPGIRFTAERPSEKADLHLWFDSDANGEHRLQIPGTAENVEFFPNDLTLHSGGPVHCEGLLSRPLTLISNAPIAYVEGFVVNLGEFWLPRRADAWIWESDEWKVTLSPVPKLGDVIKSVERAGGYALTHHVRFERNDRKPFTGDDADAVLHGLYRFLSFLQGRKVNVVLPTGHDADGKPVWRRWASWQAGPWQGVNSWADTHETEQISDAFAGFMRLWSNPDWRDSIDAAIHWYVDSNRNASVLEAGTVFNQMALERLAWEHFVIDEKTMTPERFEKLNAADRIRRMLAKHGVPHSLPSLPNLQRWAEEFRWRNIADAIAAMRNMVIHPDNRRRERLEGADDSPLIDVWHCGLWALELLLLRLFGYNGGYQDRRKNPRFAGDPDPVPWCETASGPGPAPGVATP